MANEFGNMPLTADTDFASFGEAQTLQNTPFGIRVWKLALIAADITSEGTVAITEPNSGILLAAPMVVPASSPAGTVLFYDNPTQLMEWRDFACTGLTATGTELFIWYRV